MIDDRARTILDLEAEPVMPRGVKERLIRERLDVTPTRYYQLLVRIIGDPEAVAYSPVVVNRLRRLRGRRRV